MFKFIHAADVHLDSPLLNLDQYEGAPAEALRVATREAFDNLVQIAIDEQVDFLLIAGDLYDKDSPDFHTPIHVRKKMALLEEHNIRVYIIQGNHDATTVAKKAFDVLTMPPNVYIFSTKKPETFYIDELNVAIHGQGFATKVVEENLSAKYPPAEQGRFNIGLLHTNLGSKDSHDRYAPSTVAGLRKKGYQYWALGHIHKRDKGIGGRNQIIHYPGNLQGRHIRESGPKGCTLVTVDDEMQISTKFRATDVWRWHDCEVDATHFESTDDLLVAVSTNLEKALKEADDRSLAVRVRVQGQSSLHRVFMRHPEHWRDELRRTVLDKFESRVWLEKINWETKSPKNPSTQELDANYGDLIAGIDETIPSDDVFAEIRDQLNAMLNKLPSDVRMDDEIIDLDNEATTVALVTEAKELLISRLLDESEPVSSDSEGGIA